MKSVRKSDKQFGWDYALFMVGAIGLGYMTFGNPWGAALAGWFAWMLLGTRLTIIDTIKQTELKRAVAEFDGDLELLQERLDIYKAEIGKK